MKSENTQLVASLRFKILSFLPADLPATDSEDERVLLAYLAEPSNREPVQTFWHVVRFYRVVEKNELASALILHMLEIDDSADNTAHCYLTLGQIAEFRGQYDAAIDCYARGLTFRTLDKIDKYLLHNNTGYCLNVQEKYRAAESYCRLAIEIDSTRANAFKNLGLSLVGQNDLVGAAWAWIEGTQADARDARSFHLLAKLIADYPEMPFRLPGILNGVEVCRKAVDAALQEQNTENQTTMNPPARVPAREIYRVKYVPQQGFSQLKNEVESEITTDEIEQLFTEDSLNMLFEYPRMWCVIVEKVVNPRRQFHKRICRRCRSPLERKKTVAGVPARWFCKNPRCPKSGLCFLHKSSETQSLE